MRSQAEPEKKPVYHAACSSPDVALRSDGSMFGPNRDVAMCGPAGHSTTNDLYKRFNLAPDEGPDSFEQKFTRQLEAAPNATIQLAAEVVFVQLLIASDIGGPVKRRLVDLIRSWASEPIPMISAKHAT